MVVLTLSGDGGRGMSGVQQAAKVLCKNVAEIKCQLTRM